MSSSGRPALLNAKAIRQLEGNVFPSGWAFIPVAGKDTYVKDWTTQPFTKEQTIQLYKTKSAYNGIGVVTGSLSDGLIAVDIDGPDADAKYKQAAKHEYEPYGQEKTMSWTSGRLERRQIVYRMPSQLVYEMKSIKKLYYSFNPDSDENEWIDTVPEIQTEGDYQELVIRFNACQSVLPGSRHPDGMIYKWLSYNDGMPATAPGWLLDAVRPYRKPVQFLSADELEELASDVGLDTLIPEKQIRGWFFRPEVQAKLLPRLEELVFNDHTFTEYGWKLRSGAKPQMVSGCPWHGGKSGTSFQYSTDTGCWDCKACGVHGDVLDFMHKVRSGKKHAPRPRGAELETIVAELASAIGYSYPEDAKLQVVKSVDTPRVVMNEREFHEALIRIHDEELNPALRIGRMAGLAAETGRRLTGQQCLAAMDEYRYYESTRALNVKIGWWRHIEKMDYVIPNLLQKPTQVMVHAAGGLGKTSACMGLATAIGRGSPMRIRGIDLPVKQGPVLWIQNDQSPAKLLQDCEDNGIDLDKDSEWFIVKRGFQLNHTHEFGEWIKEHRPALVVVDSIGSCSTKMQVEEKDKAFASPFYYYSEQNGAPDGFPATSIIWIHHDNAAGEARGTRYLTAAVDEQWHLRKPTDDERERLRERRLVPSSCRLIQIKKSRLGREGDLLVVERDSDFAYSVWDWTPTERREDNGQGDPEPHTMALRIVRDAVQRARESGEGPDRLTAKDVWERLGEEMTGQARKTPSIKTVRRWLDRWVASGVLVEGKKRIVPGSDKPVPSYTVPPSRARALSMYECPLLLAPRERLQEQEKGKDIASIPEEDVLSFLEESPVPKSKGQATDSGSDVLSFFPVPEGDLGEEGAKDIPTQISRARAYEPIFDADDDLWED
jgi:hypothetical protein